MTQLEKVRRLVEQPEHWTKNSLARAQDGSPAPVTSPEAVSFCLYGAVSRVADRYKDSVGAMTRIDRALALACHACTGHWDYVAFNDQATHAEMLAVVNHAIQRKYTDRELRARILGLTS